MDQVYTLCLTAEDLVKGGKYQEAVCLFEDVFKICEEKNDKERMFICAYKLSVLYYNKLRDFKKALKWSERCVELSRFASFCTKEDLFTVKLNHCKYLTMNHHKTRESLRFLEEMLISDELSKTQKGKVYLAMAWNYSFLDNFNELFMKLKKAEELIPEEDRDKGEIYSLYGRTYKSLGEYEKTIENLEKAKEIFIRHNDSERIIHTIQTLGDVYREMKEFDKAKESFELSLRKSQEFGDGFGESVTYKNIGDIMRETGQVRESIFYYEKSLKLKHVLHEGALGALYNSLGATFKELNEFKKSEYYYNLSLELFKKLNDFEGHSTTHHNMGVLYFKQSLSDPESLKKAKQHFEQSVTLLKQIKETIHYKTHEQWKVSHTDKYKANYFSLQLCCFLTNDGKTCFETSENFRANSLNELLSEHSNSPEFSTLNESEILTILEKENMQETTCLSFSVYKTRILASVIHESEKGLNVEFRDWNIENDLKLFSFNTIETLVKTYQKQRDTEIKLQKDVRSNEEITIVNLEEDCTPSRQRAFENQRDSSNSEETSTVNVDCKTLQKIMYQLFFSKTEHLIPPSTCNLIIIPDGFLYSFSFHEFIDPSSDKYLFEKYKIRLSPSIHTLKLCNHSYDISPELCKALVVGNPTFETLRIVYKRNVKEYYPIPGAEEEGRKIAAMFNTEAVIGKKANKKYFLSQISDASLIHVSSHGIESGELIFAQAFGSKVALPSEVLVSSDDLKDYKLRAELVVLSCCLTGCGKISSDGVLNVGRRFLACGAKAVIVALWNIPDEETLHFMLDFYKNLKNGLRTSESLQSTMKTMSSQHPHPKYWAAFQLIGTDVKIDHLFPNIQSPDLPLLDNLHITDNSSDQHSGNSAGSSTPKPKEIKKRVETVKRLKDRGDAFFKECNYESALEQYDAVVQELDDCLKVVEVEEGKGLKFAAHLNSAACHLHLSAFDNCIKECDEAHNMKPNYKS